MKNISTWWWCWWLLFPRQDSETHRDDSIKCFALLLWYNPLPININKVDVNKRRIHWLACGIYVWYKLHDNVSTYFKQRKHTNITCWWYCTTYTILYHTIISCIIYVNTRHYFCSFLLNGFFCIYFYWIFYSYTYIEHFYIAFICANIDCKRFFFVFWRYKYTYFNYLNVKDVSTNLHINATFISH